MMYIYIYIICCDVTVGLRRTSLVRETNTLNTAMLGLRCVVLLHVMCP